jgi:hypothetical protein
MMDKLGICASSGSACTSGALEPSHVLRALGIPFTYAHGSIRFSLSHYNTDEDVDYILEHMPKKYQYQFEKWNPGRILNWAHAIGNNTTALMKQIMDSRSHVVRGYRSCMAILSFSKTYGDEALELACTKALQINTQRVSSIESMLKRKTYLQEEMTQPVNNLFNSHDNIRGSDNYQ